MPGMPGGPVVPGIGRPYSSNEITGFLKAAGFPENLWPTFVGIAYAESGGRATARNPSDKSTTQPGGYVARGLFQIRNTLSEETATKQGYYVGSTNTRMAKSIYDRQGLGAWQAYTNGAYKQYVPTGNNALIPDFIEEPLDAAGDAVSTVKDALNPANWISAIKDAGVSVGLFVAGALIIIIGVWLLISQTKAGRVIGGIAETIAIPEAKAAGVASKGIASKAVKAAT